MSIVTVEGLRKTYGRLAAVDGISFNLEPGSIVALLGPNGAGKTTTFKCILGVTGFEGKITVAGKSVRRDGKAARRSIGYLPQTPAFSGEDTSLEALRFLADLRQVSLDRVTELLDRVGLSNQDGMRTDQLSGGMRQRLALAAALLSDPPLLLLDEPTASLDFESRRQFHELLVQLKGEGKTIVLSTHFVEHIAGLADRVIVLREGRLALDKEVEALVAGQEKRFTVHLNGTARDSFVRALDAVGIAEARISAAEPDLESAIRQTLDTIEEDPR